MGKKRRDGRASKRGNSASSSNAGARNSHGGVQQTTAGAVGIHYANGVYHGELRGGKPHGNGRLEFGDGEFYDGEWKDQTFHGRGTYRWGNGDVYEGQYVNGKRHGRGVCRYADGNVYDGEYKDDPRHGWGTFTWRGGDVYEGPWVAGKEQGKGTHKWADGRIYEGGFKDGQQHGWGTMTWPSSKYADGKVYEGQFVGGDMHGRGTMQFTSGNVFEGEWVAGKKHGKGALKYSSGDICEQIWSEGELANGDATNQCPPGNVVGESALPNADSGSDDAVAGRGILDGRKLRSQRSQQRRHEADKKACDHCGVDDYLYKLRVCSGCNLALYCSAACQKAASGSHRRICDILSILPSRDSDRLTLEYDEDKMVDFDAGLRYATKYMDELKHLQINLLKMGKDDAVKLSAKYLCSLLKSKTGELESVFLLSLGEVVIHGTIETDVWKELHGLKQLRLSYMRFDDAQCVNEIISQQKNTLEVLCLPELTIDWWKAKTRRTVAQAVSSCKHLARLELQYCVLMDSDLKVMLHDLPNLRILNLCRDPENNHELTDNTCGLIARKCPGLQELNLSRHDTVTVKGIRKIFEGCRHLRSFYTTIRKLSCEDVSSLLDVAPQLLYLYLGDQTGGVICPDCPSLQELDLAIAEVSDIIEATGGRTVLELLWSQLDFEPEGLSAKAMEKYESQMQALKNIRCGRLCDPEVANVWAGVLEE